MQEQSLLYFNMTSKLQRVVYHGNRLHFVNLKCHYERGGTFNLSLDYKTQRSPRKTKTMTNKCRHNIHLQEQESRNEYQYNAATRINKYIISKS